MISGVFFQRPSIETEKTILSLSIEFSEWLKSKDDVFSAFFKNSVKYSESNNIREKIDKNIDLIQLWIKNFEIQVPKPRILPQEYDGIP